MISDEAELFAALNDFPGLETLYRSCERTGVWTHYALRFYEQNVGSVRRELRKENYGFYVQEHPASTDLEIFSAYIIGKQGFYDLCSDFTTLKHEEIRLMDIASYILGRDLRVVPKNMYT